MENTGSVFSELNLGHTKIKNRILMGSMHTGLEEAKGGFEKLGRFYELRAKGGVGMIVTGGIAPNFRGRLHPMGHQLSFPWQIKKHKKLTTRVQKAGAKICLQILHGGRYSYHPFNVSASSTKSPITPFKASALTKLGIKKTVWDYANCANLAQKAGYDGIEIMGSEGYFLNQFIAPRTNLRNDDYGGSFENRIKIVTEILRATRKKVGPNFIIIFRLSMLDLVDNGSTFDEVVQLAKILEKEGVDLINTGIGWHEARVPTIATMVPRNTFTWISQRIKKEINIPVITTNRINDLNQADQIIKEKHADMISMARPFLADPEIVNKFQNDKADEVNTCIACNQACLDHIFKGKIASCLVNPKACHELDFVPNSKGFKQIAVIGAGPAGISFAIEAQRLGHKVSIYEKSSQIGGQFHLAKKIPGKEEFEETIRYFKKQIELLGINLHLNTTIDLEFLQKQEFDHYIFSTGVVPRIPGIEGIDHPKCISYQDLINKKPIIGKKVAIIGAGGIGFDIAEYLAHNPEHQPTSLDKKAFFKEWGIDCDYKQRGALTNKEPVESFREIYLLQRKKTKHGKTLGKTTGWIHRQSLKDKKIKMLAGVEYNKVSDQGLHLTIDEKEIILDVDHIIICAGQNSENKLYLEASKLYPDSTSLIGGAHTATEIDAKRAINQGVRLAYDL